jgi:aspartyl-tRNA(Asn)/glutamyl-tRNA(Gln) amidotransferase subunit C
MTSEDPSKISLEETRHVANLAKLEYSEKELSELNSEMSRILETVSKLDNVPVEGLEATLAVGAYANRFRDDVAGKCLDRDFALGNAPVSRDGCFEIPRILSKIDQTHEG